MKTESEVFVPDNCSEPYQRTTHLCISAHQDDVEIMAQSAIVECFGIEDKWFGAVVTADGAGSPRTGLYENFTDEQMKAIRIKEQKKAAYVGEYSFLSLLKYKSSEIKGDTPEIIEDYAQIIKKANPKILFTHNIADKHPTHVGVALKVIKAVRALPVSQRPEKLYGIEVWRDLDWLCDDKKVKLDCSKHLNLERAMLGMFDSQIEGGKRYDLATEGRRIANATYAESHGVDNSLRLTNAMDLTPLIIDDKLCVKEFISGLIEDFKNSVIKNIDSLK